MREQVAIVGMAVMLPGAADLDAYWRNLVDGVDAISEVPAHRWDAGFYDPEAGEGRADRVYCRRGGFIDEFAEVDAARFGIMPTSVAGTEPDQLIALRVAAAALADAGGPDRLPAPDRIGVVVGRGGYLTPGLVRLDQRVRTANQLVRTLRDLLPDVGSDQLERVREAFTEQLGPHQPESAIGLVPNLAASRIANRLDLRGPAYTVDAACASSLIAVDHAVAELASGRCDVVLAGGVHHCHDITLWSVFAQLRALSRREQIRPFDRAADGILIGEGTGVVVLKRLAEAARDGDRIYAVIRGTGVASDGRSASLFNPEPAGQARAVRAAWAAAGLDPAQPGSLGLLEAHGTGTPAGDTAELATLADVFGPASAGERAVIGSVKSMIGHTMPAAGVAGLVKAALAVHRGVLLPTLHCDDPHPELKRTRFRPISAAEPWTTEHGPRRAGVNAFGFGGINAHVVLEQAPDGDGTSRSRGRPVEVAEVVEVAEPEQVLRFAAPDPASLAEVLSKDDAEVRAAGLRHPHHATPGCRLGIVDPTPKRLALARRVVAKGQAWRGRNDVWFSPAPLLGGDGGARIAFVYPGLEADFSPRVEDVAAIFGTPGRSGDSSDVVTRDGRYAATSVGRHGVGVVEVGRLLDRALRGIGIRPDLVAGHSVGEWTAMICSGLQSGAAVDEFLASFDPDSLRVPGLVFAAIGAGVDRVSAALADRPGVVLSHDNAPNQSIVCGPEAEVESLVRWFRRQNVLCQVLPFRSGFHTPMLAPYLGPIEAAVDGFELHRPEVPVWSATTTAPYPEDPAEVRALFLRHLLEPVRFRPMIEGMYAAGARVFVQVGTGHLASVISDVLAGRDHLAVPVNVPQRTGVAQLHRVATALWVEGGAPDLRPLRPAPDRGVMSSESRTRAVRLDLGGALVSLGDGASDLLAGDAPAENAPGGNLPAGRTPMAPDRLAPLDHLAGRHPIAAELANLLRETAYSAVAVLGAGSARSAPVPAAPRRPMETVLTVSTATMPYLLDHCFFRQRAGWPDLTDRFPVVPATTVLHHLMAAAEEYLPGMRAVAIHDARFHRWVVAEPSVDVPVTVTPVPTSGPEAAGPTGPGPSGVRRVRAAFGSYAHAVIDLAPSHPHDLPAPWAPDPATERAPEISAAQLYTERWMFHDRKFQGVAEIQVIADTHVRGVLTTPSAPGALLDNVGQLLGYWIMATHSTRKVVFPVRMGRIRFFGPHPPAATRLDCVIRIRSVTETELVADAQLILGGRVWAAFDGWVDRRFDSHPETLGVERFPERTTLARRQPGDWCVVFERWPDLASRDLFTRKLLSAGERAELERCPPRGRRQWLLGRFAVKDAVRTLLWDEGAGPIFPAEVRVSNDETGRPHVAGLHGRDLGDLDVSLAHCAEVGVALVRRCEDASSPGVGIDVEQIVDRTAATHAVALGPAESALLAQVCADSTEPERVWFTRFWAAKEAVSKAEGTGLRGRPRRFAVVSATEDALAVAVEPVEPVEPMEPMEPASGPERPGQRRIYPVRCARIANPDDLPERQYVVAWTEGPTTEKHSRQE
ncbi:type I polyketide synthase [Actinopolymorpha alba]|uniref:type I polyketide synthase n=1 Tax=Actinopolymorpha alba TaxID=533267 RepID=UPI00036FF2C3|nr:type I polyketide synthase [Actinopolymorpha alba]